MSAQPSAGQGRFLSGSHVPEKSGWPSAVRGAGACRWGDPSANLGTPGVGYCSHCARAGTASSVAIIAAQISLQASFMERLRCEWRLYLTGIRPRAGSAPAVGSFVNAWAGDVRYWAIRFHGSTLPAVDATAVGGDRRAASARVRPAFTVEAFDVPRAGHRLRSRLPSSIRGVLRGGEPRARRV